MMVTETVQEAIKAAKQARAEGLSGLYPSAAIVLANEVARLKAALQEIADYEGCTIRSNDERRDGWKEGCNVAIDRLSEIAIRTLAEVD